MAGSIMAPLGGIVGVLAGVSHPMVLTAAEIERFEEQYAPIGMFDVLGRFLDRKAAPQLRHCRDLVILGLIGGGMAEKAAEALVTGLPLHKSLDVRVASQNLLFAAFIPPVEGSDSPPAQGDEVKASAADTTSPTKSATS